MNVLILEDRWKRVELMLPHFPYAVWCRQMKDFDRRIRFARIWDLLFLDHDLDAAPDYDGRTGMAAAEWLAGSDVIAWGVIIHSTIHQRAAEMRSLLLRRFHVELMPFEDVLQHNLGKFSF